MVDVFFVVLVVHKRLSAKTASMLHVSHMKLCVLLEAIAAGESLATSNAHVGLP